MAPLQKSIESMTIAQLQDYLRGEGVELPARTQLKKYYVDLAYQQSEIAHGNLTSPRTRWGKEPVELKTSPIGDGAKVGDGAGRPDAPSAFLSRQDEVSSSTATVAQRSDAGRLQSPERGRPIKQEGRGTPFKSPRRMREMSPLRRAKSPSKKRTEATPKTLKETLLGVKPPPQVTDGPSTSSAEEYNAGVKVSKAQKRTSEAQTKASEAQKRVSEAQAKASEPKQKVVRKNKSASWVPSFFQGSKKSPQRSSWLYSLTRQLWGGAKAGGRLVVRILSYRPPPWLILFLVLGMVVTLAVMYLQAALRPVPFCDTGVSPAGAECIPCPEHGYCEAGTLTCAVGYETVGRHCVKDKRVEARVQKLAGKVKRFVCGQRALALCGYDAAEAVTRGSVLNLLGEGQVIDQRTADIFYLAVLRAGEDLLMAAEKGVPVLVCPDDLAQHYKPLSCHVREAVHRNWRPLVLLLVSLFGALFFWRRRRRQQALVKNAEALFEKICVELEDAAHRPGGAAKWKIATHFRDSLLKPRERGGPLWKEVERLAVEDTRVLVRQQMVQGESFTVWEWRDAGAPLSPTFKGRTSATGATSAQQTGEGSLRRRSSNETPSRTNTTPARIYPSTSTINTDPVPWKY